MLWVLTRELVAVQVIADEVSTISAESCVNPPLGVHVVTLDFEPDAAETVDLKRLMGAQSTFARRATGLNARWNSETPSEAART